MEQVNNMSPIDKLINWTNTTQMTQISVSMLQDWFIELREAEVTRDEDTRNEYFKRGFDDGVLYAKEIIKDATNKILKSGKIEKLMDK